MNRQHLLIASVTILAIFVAGAVLSYRSLFSEMALRSPEISPVKIEVMAGSSLSRVAIELAEAGYLPSPTLFKLWARLKGAENSIQTGEYELHSGITPAQLLDKIVRGESVQYRITLVEGWTFQQALNALWSAGNIRSSLNNSSPADIAQQMSLDYENPEGLLYPDTYFYTKGTLDIELLRRANARLNTVLSEAWESRLGSLPFANSYEALTMASIIEKESARNSERGLIAGVFVGRLDLGMRLQSDPTIIYGMGDRYAGNITRADLLEETPYNTYRIDGIPPTPIALSGEASIVAALNPSASDFLYFVAKGDGSHQFSRSLEEHNAAVREYQLGSND
ncbi:MAG: endolytic transglycosylase MltG [Gammaproteobacteria bacterium]|nr:endolytic transglycosylase MltG [Gammaproteobacteria bacterium]